MKYYLVRSNLFILFILFSNSLQAQLEDNNLCSTLQMPNFEAVKYRATIDVIGKHLSGILILKTQPDATIRSVFINEMGVTFFDITFDKLSYTFNSVMSSFNKKAVKRSLAKDLGMIMARGIFKSFKNLSSNKKIIELKLNRKGKVHYHPNKLCNQYPLVQNLGRKKVVSIQQFYSNESSTPDSIFVEHHKVNFTIQLKQMNVTE